MPVLNLADAIYNAGSKIDKVMNGGVQLWPAAASAGGPIVIDILPYANEVTNTDANLTTVKSIKAGDTIIIAASVAGGYSIMPNPPVTSASCDSFSIASFIGDYETSVIYTGVAARDSNGDTFTLHAVSANFVAGYGATLYILRGPGIAVDTANIYTASKSGQGTFSFGPYASTSKAFVVANISCRNSSQASPPLPPVLNAQNLAADQMAPIYHRGSGNSLTDYAVQAHYVSDSAINNGMFTLTGDRTNGKRYYSAVVVPFTYT